MTKIVRKIGTIFMLMLSLSILIGGAVFAAPPTVDIEVDYPTNNPIVRNGERVDVWVIVEGGDNGTVNGNNTTTVVEIKTNPDQLQIDPNNAVMLYDDVPSIFYNNDTMYGGFLQNGTDKGTFYWIPGLLSSYYPHFGPNNSSYLLLDALVTDPLGSPIIITATLGNAVIESNLDGTVNVTFEEIFDTAEYIINEAFEPVDPTVNNSNATTPTKNIVQAKTVPMQKTGLPLIPFMGALLTIASGLLCGIVLREN